MGNCKGYEPIDVLTSLATRTRAQSYIKKIFLVKTKRMGSAVSLLSFTKAIVAYALPHK